MYDRICVSSAHFVPTAAPAPSITLLLNMYNYIHVPALEKLDCALAYVFDICSVCGDHVDDTQYPLLARAMAVVVVVVVSVAMVVVSVRMAIRGRV